MKLKCDMAIEKFGFDGGIDDDGTEHNRLVFPPQPTEHQSLKLRYVSNDEENHCATVRTVQCETRVSPQPSSHLYNLIHTRPSVCASVRVFALLHTSNLNINLGYGIGDLSVYPLLTQEKKRDI